MREIKLTQGQVALVDDADYDYLMQWKWYAKLEKSSNRYYVRRSGRKADGSKEGKTICMQNQLFKTPAGMVVDHLNHDPTHNYRSNLRLCTPAQNNMNQRPIENTASKLKGVSRNGDNWRARINVDGSEVHIGTFNTKEDAYKAYCEASKKHHGEFGCTK